MARPPVVLSVALGSSGNVLTTMLRRRGSVLALVLAGGEGNRLGPLTENRAKPAVPFAGSYRLIDFPLSNCHHSRVSDVWVLQQYDPRVLTDHLSNGRPWDLDRTYGGLRVVHPSLGDEEESGFYEGNADAIRRSCASIRAFDPELVLVLSADAVYRLDYAEVLERHLDSGAELTMVTTEVPQEQAGRFGVVEVEGERVRGFEYKPERPRTNVVTTEVFVYEARLLLETVAEPAEGEDERRDFGHELLPRLVERGNARAFPLAGYWRDVGTLESYWEAHMDLLGPEPLLDLDDRRVADPDVGRTAAAGARARRRTAHGQFGLAGRPRRGRGLALSARPGRRGRAGCDRSAVGASARRRRGRGCRARPGDRRRRRARRRHDRR